VNIRVGHLYADYLNIYADRGNMAVLAARAAARGHELDVTLIGLGDPARDDVDLFYIGGGQDREQELVAPDLAGRADALRTAVEGGAAILAVCGGYQLLGHFYRDLRGVELPGAGLLPLHTVAGERRMIGDVLLDCPWAGETLAGFENHAGRTILDAGAEALGRVVSGSPRPSRTGRAARSSCRRSTTRSNGRPSRSRRRGLAIAAGGPNARRRRARPGPSSSRAWSRSSRRRA